MRAFVCVVVGLLPLAAAAQVQDLPSAEAFGPGSGRVWLSHCAFEADRYVSCKNAARPVLEALATPGDGTPGAALQAFMRDLFVAKGCAFDIPEDSFRVNGIFLSFDSAAAMGIRCEGKESKLEFAPGVITLLDTLYFFSDAPPQ
jgi:hypothetical protein